MAEKLNVTKSVEMYERACGLIPAGSQTNSKRATAYAPGAYPIYFDHADGCRITDVDGNTYIDYVLALGPITLGYCYDAIDEAVAAQLEKGIIAGLLSPLEVEVVERLREIVPCCEMARFMKGGAEGTQAAARIARGYTGKEIILNSGYRGWADQWAAQSGNPAVPEVLGETIQGFPRDDLDALEALLKKYEGNVAMIALDVASGTAAPREVVEGIRRLADEYGALLMFDEIVTGFRLAPGGGQEYYGVTPDLAVFAKGMANGMPIAAVCGREDVMQQSKDLVISITYGGEALSLAAANASLQTYAEEPVTDHMFRQGSRLAEAFERIANENGVPFKCHGLAPQHSMSFGYDDSDLVSDVWTLLLQEMAKRGVLLRRGGLLFITYSHDDEAIEETISVMDECMPIIADAVENDTVSDFLETGEVEKSFRSFT
ncbi:MAG: aminotransferase class III-fold pyridoxal phosphate-dependent enzyme [Armatimonadota bacterium]